MDDDTRVRRAATFGSAPNLYDDARPGYARDAVAWAVPDPTARVLDLGAGTGKLTRALRAAGHDVVAVEPSPEMLAVLRQRSPEVDARVGSAEATGLPDGAVDAVTVGSAFHWFARPAADAEIARVLRPGGTVALLWNPRDSDDPLAAVFQRFRGPGQRGVVADRGTVLDPAWFGPTEVAEFGHTVEVDADRLIGMVASRSYVLDLPDDERTALLADLHRFVADELGLVGDLTRPLRLTSLVVRARLR